MVKVTSQNCSYPCKGLVSENTHVKYQSSSTYFSKLITNVKVIKKVKLQDQGNRLKNVGTHRKGLPLGDSCENSMLWLSLFKSNFHG